MRFWPVPCPLCARRPLCDAVLIRGLVQEPDATRPRGVVLLGCRPCLRRRLLEATGSQLFWLSRPPALRHLPWSVGASLANLCWFAMLALVGPTRWFREALNEAGIPFRDLLTDRELGTARPLLDPEQQLELARCLLVLLHAVAASDAETSVAEWNALRAYLQQFGFAPGVFEQVDPGRQAREAPLDGEVRHAYERLRVLLGREDARLLADLMYGVADATDGVLEVESRTARRLLALAGVPQVEIDTVFDPEPLGDLDAADPWEVLELPPGSPIGRARRRWLELLQVHAPERFAPLGVEQLRRAKERRAALNAAWTALSERAP